MSYAKSVSKNNSKVKRLLFEQVVLSSFGRVLGQ